MGKLMGGTKQKTASTSQSLSENQAYPSISDAFSSNYDNTSQTSGALKALLGLGGDTGAQKGALDQFADSTGMGFLQDQIGDQVTSSKAASGLLQSGSYGKALQDRGGALGSTYLNQYLDNLFKFGNIGLSSGQLVGSTGGKATSSSQSNGSGSSKPGLGGLLGAAASLAPGS